MKNFDVIIIGGSYAGFSAALALGRASRQVLIVDNGQPCNRTAPHSHNFLTRDGETPGAIASIGRAQVLAYPTVQMVEGEVLQAKKVGDGFEVVAGDVSYQAKKLLFATGVKDILPATAGFADSWGISIIHCPYCHGYEFRDQPTAVLGAGEAGFEFVRFIQHWSKDISLFTNGPSQLTEIQNELLGRMNIKVIENEILELRHHEGLLDSVIFKDDLPATLSVLYARVPFTQKTLLPEKLGCELDEHGLIKTDDFQKTSVPGIFAAGDCSILLRSVSAAVASGTKAGAMINHQLISESYPV